MKKLFSLLLAVILILPLGACAEEGGDGVANYLYNGAECLDIHEVWTGELNTQYPFAILRFTKYGTNVVSADLFLTDIPLYRTSDSENINLGEAYPKSDGYCLWYKWGSGDSAWEKHKELELTAGEVTGLGFNWVSYDVYDASDNSLWQRTRTPLPATIMEGGTWIFNGTPLPSFSSVDISHLQRHYHNYIYIVKGALVEGEYLDYALLLTSRFGNVTATETELDAPSVYLYRLNEDNSAWEYVSFVTSSSDVVCTPPIWSNADVYYADDVEGVGGTLYLAASQPVLSKLSVSVAQMMSYNGVELPELPEWDKETYPYAVIVQGTDGNDTRLFASPRAMTFSSTSIDLIGFNTTSDEDVIYFVLMDGVWEQGSWTANYVALSNFGSQGHIRESIWTSHDILYKDSTKVYLAASEPVVVGVCVTENTATVNFSCSNLSTTDQVYRIKAWCYPKGTDYWTAPATWESDLFGGTTHSESVAFTGLLPGTEYEVYACIYANNQATEHNALATFTTEADESGTPALAFFANQIATDRFELWLLTKYLPSDAEYTAVVEVYKNDTDHVFRNDLPIDGGSDINGVWLTELKPGTEYTAYVDIYETTGGSLVLHGQCTVTTAEEPVEGYHRDSFISGFASGLGATVVVNPDVEWNSWTQGRIVGDALRKAL